MVKADKSELSETSQKEKLWLQLNLIKKVSIIKI